MAPDALKPNCPQCGGPVPVPEGAAYAHCSFCGSESFVDLNGALLYQVIKPTVGRPRVQRLVQAAAHDAGWTGIRIDDLELTYEPVWELELANGSRLRIGARPGPEGRFGPVELPGGERAFVQPSQRDRSAAWSEPELAPESVAEVAARATGRPVSLKTIRLVHHPIFSGHTTIEGSRYDFRLDAVNNIGQDFSYSGSFEADDTNLGAIELEVDGTDETWFGAVGEGDDTIVLVDNFIESRLNNQVELNLIIAVRRVVVE